DAVSAAAGAARGAGTRLRISVRLRSGEPGAQLRRRFGNCRRGFAGPRRFRSRVVRRPETSTVPLLPDLPGPAAHAEKARPYGPRRPAASKSFPAHTSRWTESTPDAGRRAWRLFPGPSVCWCRPLEHQPFKKVDNVTHTLTGLMMSRAGLGKRIGRGGPLMIM